LKSPSSSSRSSIEDAHPPEEDDLIRSLVREKGELQRRHGHQILIFAQLASHSLSHVKGSDPWSLEEMRELSPAIDFLINNKEVHFINTYPSIPGDLHKRRVCVRISHTRGSTFRKC
jgi:hypothetical protein